MQLVIKEKNKYRINRLLDGLLYLFGYTVVFIIITRLFDTVYVDDKHYIIWSAIIVILLYLLNKTVKPILVTLTIPITGLTLGLFYPCINVIILKLADWILGSHFDINNIFIAIFFGILLSITNFIMDKIIKKIIEKVH